MAYSLASATKIEKFSTASPVLHAKTMLDRQERLQSRDAADCIGRDCRYRDCRENKSGNPVGKTAAL